MKYHEEQAVIIYDKVLTVLARIALASNETLHLLLKKLDGERMLEEPQDERAIGAIRELCKHYYDEHPLPPKG